MSAEAGHPGSAAACPRCSAKRRAPGERRRARRAARGGVREIAIARIRANPTSRAADFDEEALAELAESIAERGVIQPIVVRPHGDGFQIVAGERRWRAAQRARLHEIPAIVREFDDATTAEIALIENIQREDLNAIEEAEGYRQLIERLRPHPGGARQARPQVAQPCRQPVEIARSSANGSRGADCEASSAWAMRARSPPRRDPEALAARSSPRACRCARPRRCAQAGQARAGRATSAAPVPSAGRRRHRRARAAARRHARPQGQDRAQRRRRHGRRCTIRASTSST